MTALAYLFTFSTYGHRLHGSSEYSVDKNHRGFGTPAVGPRPGLENYERNQMKTPPVVLADRDRQAVLDGILECAPGEEIGLLSLSMFAPNTCTP